MTNISVLCVDDDSLERGSIQRSFQEGLTPDVDVAKGYNSALEKIRQRRYDLIVLDGLDGACLRICHDIKEIPHGDIIIFSGDQNIKDLAGFVGVPFYNKSQKNLEIIIAKYKTT